MSKKSKRRYTINVDCETNGLSTDTIPNKAEEIIKLVTYSKEETKRMINAHKKHIIRLTTLENTIDKILFGK